MVFDELLNACTASGVEECAERDFLINHASALGAIFAQVMHARYFRLRMDIVSNNALRKFHVDAVTARLIFTYRGTGRQNGIAADEADPRDIYTSQTGEPIILRGKRWPEVQLFGVLHRSSPSEDTEEARLTFLLAPVVGPHGEVEELFMNRRKATQQISTRLPPDWTFSTIFDSDATLFAFISDAICDGIIPTDSSCLACFNKTLDFGCIFVFEDRCALESGQASAGGGASRIASA